MVGLQGPRGPGHAQMPASDSYSLQHQEHLLWSLHNQDVRKELSSQLRCRLKEPLPRACQAFWASIAGAQATVTMVFSTSVPLQLQLGSYFLFSIIWPHYALKNSLRPHLPKSHGQLTTLFRTMGNWLLLLNLQHPAQTIRPLWCTIQGVMR